MTLADSILEISGTVAEAAVLFQLLWGRVYRRLPVFTFYLAWSLLSDVGQSALVKRYPVHGLRIYVFSLAIDSLFQFGVLIELSAAVLQPLKKLLPRWIPIALGVIIAVICAAIWPFANVPGSSQFPPEGHLLVHLQQSISILRILYFLALAGCSQLLSIGWRDRELQIATGLGFYSMVSVAVSVIHTSQDPAGIQYHLMDQIGTASYVCSLVYWIVCFAQQEAARREFTPQMQDLLLAVAGSARSARMAMRDSDPPKDKDRDKDG